MSEHTKEPWAVDPDDRPGYEWNNHIVSATNPNQTICFMTHDNTPQNIEGEANARRIVACVNACAGIPTYQLFAEDDKPNLLGEVIDSLRRELAECQRALAGGRAEFETFVKGKVKWE